MNKEWVDQKNKEFLDNFLEKGKQLKEKLEAIPGNYAWKKLMLAAIEKVDNFFNGEEIDRYYDFTKLASKTTTRLISDAIVSEELDLGILRDWENYLRRMEYDSVGNRYGDYLDSDPMEFDGDILITDPCYLLADRDDWEDCEYGECMDILGIYHCMTRDTIYGDWGCTCFNSDTKKKIGEFCADAGMVGVFLLDEVLEYNPGFNGHTDRTWTTTWIKDFKGTVQFVVEHTEGVSEITGHQWEDFNLHIVGHGVNKKTGEPINFITKQTSL